MKSLLDKVNAKLNAQGGFLKAVSVLVGGTAFAQGIGILSLPILTRLYSPEDFTLFAVYVSLLAILSVASCLRFEIAIPIPREDSEAVQLVLLALISSFLISIFLGSMVWIFHTEILYLLKQPDFSNLIWLVPIGVLFSGIYNSLQYWATRRKQFPVIAKTRMVQSISGVSIQIIMGAAGFAALGLIVGQIVKVSAGIRSLTISFWGEAYEFLKKLKFSNLENTFKKNDKYPKYSTFEALANSAGIQLPVIIIAAFTVGAEAGFLMLAMQIMAIPMRFIGGAVSQVYLSYAPEKYKLGKLSSYTFDCILKLVKIGVIPLIVICLLAPFIVPYVFGAKWERTGDMMIWMLPWFIMQLIVSPVSMSLHITGHQRMALMLQTIGLVIRVGGLCLFGIYIDNYMFEYYAISGFIFYCIYLLVVFLIIKISDNQKREVPL